MDTIPSAADPLTDAEREIMLARCECGHTINDHGSLSNCWLCDEDNESTCDSNFEDLLCERIGAIVTGRAAQVS